jgi:hypothetical protein
MPAALRLNFRKIGISGIVRFFGELASLLFFALHRERRGIVTFALCWPMVQARRAKLERQNVQFQFWEKVFKFLYTMIFQQNSQKYGQNQWKS